MRIEVEVNEKGEIRHRNILMNKDRKKSDYQGSARMKLDGNRFVTLGVMTEDPNTKNRIENHECEGYVIDDHIFILETYDELFDDGNVERRRNHIHYFLLSETEIVMLGDMYVNDELLVIAGTTITKKET
jgi:hypothetical protein